MGAVVIIIAAVIFVVGVAAGIVLIVSIGINKEERDFFALQAPDRMSQGARSMTGLYVRRQGEVPVPEALIGQDMLV